VLAQQLPDPHVHGSTQHAHLVARIVDVKLTVDGEPGPLQHLGQHVAHRRMARADHVQRSRGVRADELHQYPLAAPHIALAVIGPRGQDPPQHRREPFFFKEEIDKAGTRHLGPLHEGPLGLEMTYHGFGDLARGCAGLPGQHHRGVGSPVPVGPILGTLYLNLSGRDVAAEAQLAGRTRPVEAVRHQLLDLRPHLGSHAHCRPLPKPRIASRTTLAARMAVMSLAAWGGDTSTRSIARTRSAGRRWRAARSSPGVTPPGPGVPVPGAKPGSTTSMSTVTYTGRPDSCGSTRSSADKTSSG